LYSIDGLLKKYNNCWKI